MVLNFRTPILGSIRLKSGISHVACLIPTLPHSYTILAHTKHPDVNENMINAITRASFCCLSPGEWAYFLYKSVSLALLLCLSLSLSLSLSLPSCSLPKGQNVVLKWDKADYSRTGTLKRHIFHALASNTRWETLFTTYSCIHAFDWPE